MSNPAELEELKALCPGAQEIPEARQVYIFLPNLKLPAGCKPPQADALLCAHSREGYPTRLFLSQPVVGKGSNWNTHRIADKTWHTWSWNYVSAEQRLIQILLGHLEAFR